VNAVTRIEDSFGNDIRHLISGQDFDFTVAPRSQIMAAFFDARAIAFLLILTVRWF